MARPVAIIQARMGSSRLPGKILAPLAQGSALDYVLARTRLARTLTDVVLATSDDPRDDVLETWARERGVTLFRGPQDDVLLRYHQAASLSAADPIVRVNGDCPLHEPAFLDRMVEVCLAEQADYVCTEGHPLGANGGEAISWRALDDCLRRTEPHETYYREHVMTYITAHPELYKVILEPVPAKLARGDLRLCVDEPADLELVAAIADRFAPRMDFTLAEILAFLTERPELAQLNAAVRQRS